MGTVDVPAAAAAATANGGAGTGASRNRIPPAAAAPATPAPAPAYGVVVSPRRRRRRRRTAPVQRPARAARRRDGRDAARLLDHSADVRHRRPRRYACHAAAAAAAARGTACAAAANGVIDAARAEGRGALVKHHVHLRNGFAHAAGPRALALHTAPAERKTGLAGTRGRARGRCSLSRTASGRPRPLPSLQPVRLG